MRPSTRSAGDDKMSLAERGRWTRAKLVEASRTIFENDGFADARNVDIARAAGRLYGRRWLDSTIARRTGTAMAPPTPTPPPRQRETAQSWS
jgi:hypothetical protein